MNSGFSGWRSAIIIFTWLIVAWWQSRDIFRAHPDLLYSVIILTSGWMIIAVSLRRGAWRIMKPAMLSVTLWGLFLFFFFATGIRTSLFAGDFGPHHFLDYACAGFFHLHHWQQSLAGLDVVMLCLMFLARGNYIAARVLCFASFSFLLLAIAISNKSWGLSANESLLKVMLAYVILFGVIFWTMEEAKSKAFSWLIAISIAVMLSIHANGLIGIMLDLQSGRFPDPLIFLYDPQCNVQRY